MSDPTPPSPTGIITNNFSLTAGSFSYEGSPSFAYSTENYDYNHSHPQWYIFLADKHGDEFDVPAPVTTDTWKWKDGLSDGIVSYGPGGFSKTIDGGVYEIQTTGGPHATHRVASHIYADWNTRDFHDSRFEISLAFPTPAELAAPQTESKVIAAVLSEVNGTPGILGIVPTYLIFGRQVGTGIDNLVCSVVIDDSTVYSASIAYPIADSSPIRLKMQVVDLGAAGQEIDFYYDIGGGYVWLGHAAVDAYTFSDCQFGITTRNTGIDNATITADWSSFLADEATASTSIPTAGTTGVWTSNLKALSPGQFQSVRVSYWASPGNGVSRVDILDSVNTILTSYIPTAIPSGEPVELILSEDSFDNGFAPVVGDYKLKITLASSVDYRLPTGYPFISAVSTTFYSVAAPDVEIYSIQSGDNLIPGVNVFLEWNMSDDVDPPGDLVSAIYFRLHSEDEWTLVQGDIAGPTHQYLVSIPDEISYDASFCVTVTDTESKVGSDIVTFSIFETLPTISMTQPPPPANGYAGDLVSFVWDADSAHYADNQLLVFHQWSVDGGESWSDFSSTSYAGDLNASSLYLPNQTVDAMFRMRVISPTGAVGYSNEVSLGIYFYDGVECVNLEPGTCGGPYPPYGPGDGAMSEAWPPAPPDHDPIDCSSPGIQCGRATRNGEGLLVGDQISLPDQYSRPRGPTECSDDVICSVHIINEIPTTGGEEVPITLENVELRINPGDTVPPVRRVA